MIIHNIDMTKINEPEYSKVYEAKMLGLLPEWEKWFEDPFKRNLKVKKTKCFKKAKLLRSFVIFYKPKTNIPSDHVSDEKRMTEADLDKVVKGMNKPWKSKRAKSKGNGFGKNVRFYYGRIRP